MLLSDRQITEFKTLYKNHFGKKISREEAYEKGINLINLIRILYRPITKNEYTQLKKRREETRDL